MRDHVRILEVGPRDGLQNEKTFVPTEQKLKFIENLIAAGLKEIEATAFVSKKWIPPLADSAELSTQLPRVPGVTYTALVPNLKGYEQAKKFSYDRVSLILAVTQSHNQKNLNANTEKAFERYEQVIAQAKQDKMPFRVYISCAFGCPYEGEIDPVQVIKWSKAFYDLGASELAISDTIGVGTPEQTRELVKLLLQEFPKDRLALHLHDTNNRALENCEVALNLGIRAFDSSAGGIGGCPYAPGAKGNVETERLVKKLHSLGFETGIDLEKLKEASKALKQLL
ncbi:MAG: hydroxymethylglutaryl-CoA lyase [Deltaproteobacteria bacterium]|nr:hydroxymethylglutaryl-CoA lyase [Deltaproteobacteria bacterium]